MTTNPLLPWNMKLELCSVAGLKTKTPKVHFIDDHGKPLCIRKWKPEQSVQMEIGNCNCKKCLKLRSET